MAGLALLMTIAAFAMYQTGIKMPGKSFQGELPALSPEEQHLAKALEADVTHLASSIGLRNYQASKGLQNAKEYIQKRFAVAGYTVNKQQFQVRRQTFSNLEVTVEGTTQPEEIVIVGAHYDTVLDSPGADDNASGIAALLALAERFAETRRPRTIRFVAFANEEPPFFQTDSMGSRVYAERCRSKGEQVVGMISLEMLGYYSEEAGSQSYPIPLSFFYPDKGNFIGFVGNLASRAWVRKSIRAFRESTPFPSEGAALPSQLAGVGLSDHWSFWQEGYPALMVTDTAFFRYPHYHSPNDTPEKLDYEKMARVVDGLERVVRAASKR